MIEGRLIGVALRALGLGVDVVLDFGLWSRDERTALRSAARDAGAAVRLRHLDVDPVEQRRRIDRRHAHDAHTTWVMSDDEVAAWAAAFETPTPGEVDDTEPLDDPPAGFATWDDWRAHRWQPAVG